MKNQCRRMSEAMGDYTVQYNQVARASEQMLPDRDVRDQHIRHVLNRAVITSLKSFAVRVGLEQSASLS